MKKTISLFLMIFSCVVLAVDEPCDHLRNAVLLAVYDDTEFRSYVCPNEAECSMENFLKMIDIELVDLEQAPSKNRFCEFLVLPKSKGKQYPTLVFVGDHTRARLVLSDYENGLSIAGSGTHGMRDLISQAHPTPGQLVKTTYSWDGKKYLARKTKCFKVIPKDNGRSTTLLPQACE